MVWVLSGVAALYVAVCVGMALMEPRLVFPAPQVDRKDLHAQATRFGARELTVTTEDGIPLYGWRYGDGERLVLVFSGNGATVGAWTPRYERFAAEGFAVLHVNYRGYPGSTGSPSEEGLHTDARAIWAEALRTHAAEDVLIYGKSLGGGVAARLTASLQQPPRALVLESTFTAVSDVAAETWWFLPVGLIMRNPFRTRDVASSLDLPVLIVHGTQDRLIPPHHGEALHGLIPGSQLVLVEGAEHNDDLLAHPEPWQALLGLAR